MAYIRLIDLKYKCMQLGLEPTPTRHRKNPDRLEVSVNDCIDAIRNYYIDKYKTEGRYYRNLELMGMVPTPMLAGLIRRQSKKVQEKIWSDYDNDWQFQRKYNGIRFLLFWDNDTKELSMFSRTTDPDTMLPIDYKDNFMFDTSNLNIDSFVIDAELIYRDFESYNTKVIQEEFMDTYEYEGKVDPDGFKFIVFDCLYSNDWITDKPLRERQTQLLSIFKELKGAKLGYAFEMVDVKPAYMNKEDYYYSIIDYQGEGVIAKLLDSKYTFGRSDSWVKIKPDKSNKVGVNFGDNLDAFVSGYLVDSESNKINVLLFSVYLDNSPVLVGKYYLNKDLQDKVTRYDNTGSIIMNPGFFNQVGTFEYQELTKHYIMVRPKLLYWRLDKSPESCKYTKDYFDSLI